MNTPERLPANDHPQRSGVSPWREFFARALGPVDLEIEPGVPFEGKSTLIAPLGLSVIWCRASGRIRFASGNGTRGGAGTFVVIVNLAGEMTASQNGTSVPLSPGEAVAVSTREPGSMTVSSAEFSCVTGLCARLTGAAGEIGNAPRRIPRENEALGHLIRTLRSLREAPQARSPEMQHLIAAHIYDLIGMTLEPHSADAHGIRAARLSALKADILENIYSRDLSVRSVACRQRVSPRYVHMLFENEGQTFSEFVLGQRLAHAHRMLLDPRFARKSISSIAFESGFGDLSYFDRTFRRRFGATPSEVRRGRPALDSGGAQERALPAARARHEMLRECLEMRAVSIRRFEDEDAAATARVFYDAVHAGTGGHYDEAQKNAWAPQVPETSDWRQRLASQTTLVAQLDRRVVGFMSLSCDGLIDLLFVAPDAARKGVAAQLHNAMLAEAGGMGIRRLCTRASQAARKFFESQGWAVVDEQAVSRDGVRLTNFVMERYLP